MPPSNSPILVLDGGLGTSLEDKYGVKFSSKTTPLWSSDPLVSDPETLLCCQRDFGRVPVDVIETATYQVSVKGFESTQTEQWPDGIDRGHIPGFLKKAVDIADQARGKPEAKLGLSLGPYGSTMIPGQEYSGVYDESHDDEEKLVAWWTDRLSLFTGPEVMDRISYVACETLPRLDEVRAVRKVIKGFTSKPYWISCVFPGPDDQLPDGSDIDQVVQAMLLPDGSMTCPWGIGINCTKIDKVEGLIQKFEEAVTKGVQEEKLTAWPALVLYPDGTNGEVYNTTTQIWEQPADKSTDNAVSFD